MSRFLRSLCVIVVCGSAMGLSCGSEETDGSGASAGAGGSGGSGGTSTGGSGATAGSGGTSETGGGAGQAGVGGSGGSAGGSSGAAGSSGTAGSGGTVTDAGPDGSAGVAGDAGTDAAPSEPRLVLAFDRAWIRTQVEQDQVTASCWHVDASGVKQPDPGDLVLSSTQAPLSPGVFAFADAGVYEITCSSASLGMSVTEPAIVAYEGFDYRYVKAIQTMSDGRARLEAIVAANQAGSETAYGAAVDALEALAGQIPDLSSVPLLIENPNGWPTDQALANAGLTAGPDDTAWVAALNDLRTAIAAEKAALQGLSTPPTDAQAQALTQAYALTRTRLDAFVALSPSELAGWKNLNNVASLLYEMAETSRTRFTVLADLFRNDPPGGSPTALMGPGLRFSLVGTLASIAIQETLGAYTYSSVLKNAGKVIVANMISMAIKDLLNANFVPGAHAPAIDSVHGSSAGFVVPGNGFQVLGSFNDHADRSRIVFIPPQIANDLATIVDFVDGINGLTQEGNVLKLINGVRNLIDNLITMFGAASGAGSQSIVLTPSGGDDFILEYPPLPYGINCSPYGLPVAGTMIPLDFDYGRGLAINVNVIGEPAGNCQ